MRRLWYPYELSWMEGVFADHARRILHGNALYAAPGAEHIALLYTPICHYVTAGLMWLGVPGFYATRLLSISSLCIATLIGSWLVARATGYRTLAACTPFLVLAQYFAVEAYADVGRPDNLLGLWLILSVASLALRSDLHAFVGLVVFATLAIFTKQSSILFFAVFMTIGVFIRPKVVLSAALMTALIALVVGGWVNRTTSGWFSVYVIELPAHHRLSNEILLEVLAGDFLGKLALPTCVLAIALLGRLVVRLRRRPRTAMDLTYSALLAGALASGFFSLVSRWNIGGAQNVLVPYAVLVAVLVPAAVARGIDSVASPQIRAIGWRTAMLVFGLVILCGLEDPRPYMPGEQDHARWQRFKNTLRAYGDPTRIWVVGHGAVFGDDQEPVIRPHAIAIADVLGDLGVPTGRPYPEALRRLISQRYFDVVVVPRDADQRTPQELAPYYEPDPNQPPHYLPVFSGWHPGVEVFWIRRPSP